MEHLRRFAAHDMSFHCQVVLCPASTTGRNWNGQCTTWLPLRRHALDRGAGSGRTDQIS
ncbi:MAG: hypothetical protein ACLR4A_05180 [Christensenellales bacterium]